jgi:hypothetical protein
MLAQQGVSTFKMFELSRGLNFLLREMLAQQIQKENKTK